MLRFLLIAVLLQSCSVIVATTTERISDYHQHSTDHYVKWLQKLFLERYLQKCHKYSWIEKYVNNYYQFKKYTIFIYDDNVPRPKKGGFGDRLAGMVTAFLWSVRSNRTFLIESTNQKELFHYFQPFPYYLYRSKKFMKNHFEAEESDFASETENNHKKHLKWSDWEKYFDFNEGTASNKTYTWCINPKPRQIECGFDSNQMKYNDYTVVRIRSNRCYLCRWVENDHFPAQKELLEHFNISKADNLFDLAGCVLRNILWPTGEMWKELKKQIVQFQKDNQPPSSLALPSIQASSPLDKHSSFQDSPSSQIGVHFRCGDHNYQSQNAIIHSEMTNHFSCVAKPNETWNGTMAVYEFSSASPIDMGNCVNYHQTQLSALDNLKTKKTTESNWIYISSDSMDSSHQIYETIGKKDSSRTIISSKGCHLDYNPSHDCIVQTFVSWFLLSMNNRTIVQSYYHKEKDLYLPSSSFSRYAMMYSLNSESFDFGDRCYLKEQLDKIGSQGKDYFQSPFLEVENTRIPQGNWVCVGKNIY
jgi:hypothetical protein